jgi:outer membrane PBP1 activator LpoA protein
MNKVFLDLYLDGKADTMPPIEALTLYYDFRDMTPIGRQGDEIVRNLANRLIGVDLLDQAAELLNYQVENRLRGVAKAQIAADLAVVDLLNRKPQDALKVLNKTRQSSLPASIERQRRMVEARALSESGRGDIAIELLGQLVGSDVDRLKADIAWKAKNWRDAGERLETMLAGRWSDSLPLEAQERQDVLRAAIAYALANDQLALDRLRTKFGDKMSNSPNARAFEVVTSPIQTQGSEFRSLAKEIASVDTMRSFLDEYRQQYLNKSPSKPAPAAPPGPGLSDNTAAKPNDVASADPAKK